MRALSSVKHFTQGSIWVEPIRNPADSLEVSLTRESCSACDLACQILQAFYNAARPVPLARGAGLSAFFGATDRMRISQTKDLKAA